MGGGEANLNMIQTKVQKEESLAASFLKNELLYGKDREEKLIAIHQLSDTQIRLYRREGNLISFRDEGFYPFFFLSNSGFLKNFQTTGDGFWLKELSGNNYYKYLAIFKSWKDYRRGIDFATEMKHRLGAEVQTNQIVEEDGNRRIDEIYSKGDAATQYLFQTGKTLFKGMDFSEIHRLQLDIETYYERASQQQSGIQIGRDKIIIVSLSDSTGWETVLDLRQFEDSEEAMLVRLIEVIKERDPDVIEGHNIFGFDLPYIQKRCELYDLKFAIGRDGKEPRTYPASIRFAERTIDYPYCEISGRHVVDTLFLVQYFDMAKRAMPSYSLKEAAKYFGFAAENRTYIDHKDIAEAWDKTPERLLAYALDDVRETSKLSAMLSGSNFYMTQMMPFSYGQVSRMGPAAKIEALFVREYLREKHSIPRPQIGQQQSGGFTEVFLKGILGPIVYADVESLYPSIMLTYDVCPTSDERKLFPKILTDLKSLRFAAKTRMKSAVTENEKETYDAMQNSFKVLINSMYGYLGFRAGIFNDYEQADKVTTTGQAIAKKMIREFESRKCRVVEVDTDGILLIPPPEIVTKEEEEVLVKTVSATMPEGITIAYDGRFKKMISYMKKNYVLLSYDGKMKIKGSSLVSRSGEKFGRDFVKQGFECLLNEDVAGLHKLYIGFRDRILNREMEPSEFSRTESLKSTLDDYHRETRRGKRMKAITYELAIKNKLTVVKGDRITFYVAGSGFTGNQFDKGKLVSGWKKEKPDQNVDFYVKRLNEFADKFKPFFQPNHFSQIFTADELFPFSAEGIDIIKEILHRDTADIETEVPF
jgi:DNA polymerase, archaea type